MRRVVAMLSLLACAWAGLLALEAAPTLAATGHKFLSQLKGTTLVGPEAVAVSTTGEVFVADAEAVDVFGASGEFKTRIGAGVLEGELTGVAVDAKGRVYVADAGAGMVKVFKPNGPGAYVLLSEWSGANTTAKAFGEVAGVAVDNSTSTLDPSAGDVYVVDRPEGVVDVFKPQEGAEEAKEGKFVRALKGKPAFEEPNGVAVNSATGQVYVANSAKGLVEVFSSAGVFESNITGKGTPTKAFATITAVAVDEATKEVYVTDGEGKAVDQFNAAGVWIGWLTIANGAPFVEPHGVAIAPGGDVYVADKEAPAVDVFGPDVVVPGVTTSNATKVERTGAILNGSVNTEGKPAKYHFEYGQEEGPRTSTPTVATEGLSKVHASTELLTPESRYEFRLVAENENGTSYGAYLEFVTPPSVTGVTTGAASSVEATSATVAGSLEPEGLHTKYHFEYGTSTSYGRATPEAETNATGVVPVTAGLAGLSPNTTYHFRLVATNQFGTTAGGDASFKTSGPPAIVSKPTEAIGDTAATLHAEVNPGKLATKYHFEYGETTSYGTSTPVPDGELVAGEASVPLPPASLTGLKLATTYHFRVVATNAAGTTDGPDQEFTTGPIDNESAKEVTGESAVLHADINPFGHDTKYHFEYGETASYGTSIPVPDGDLGSAEGDKSADVPIAGLHPGTTYHYRVVATVEGVGTGFGRDQTFTTGTSGVAFTLPDHRAYEMLTPANKQGGFVWPLTGFGAVIQSSEDGSAFAYVVDGPVVENPEGNRSPEVQQVLATRGASAWSSQELVAPHERAFGLRPGQLPEYEAFSSDLSVSIVQPFPGGLTPLAEPPLAPPLTEAEKKPCPTSSDPRPCQEKTIYARNNAPLSPGAGESAVYSEAKQSGEAMARERGESTAKPGYVPLVSYLNSPGGKFGGTPFTSTLLRQNLIFQSATPDLSHVVLLSSVPLTKTPSSAAPGLYEWSAGQLQLVSVLPAHLNEHGVLEPGVPAKELAADLGYGYNQQGSNTRHAISNDGTRVIWTHDVRESTEGAGHLYVTDTEGEAQKAGEKTLQLDAAEEGLPEESGLARFQTASADGSRVFFTDARRLTTNSKAGPGKEDLYEAEVAPEAGGKLRRKQLTDLTAEQPAGDESAAVEGAVLGASEEGSYIYFVARGVLAHGGQSGAFNLYGMHREGAAWTTKFIAGLSEEDGPDWINKQFSEGQAHLNGLTARVSPNGRYLAFMSNQRLTGYDNTDVYEEEVAGKRVKHADEEVFLFDSAANSGAGGVTCASCNPSGARPRGVFDTHESGEGGALVVDKIEAWGPENKTGGDHWLAGNIPGWTAISQSNANYQSRYLSDEGRLFFNSADPLVSAAAGHTRVEEVSGKKVQVGVENVYQYEPGGIGSCTTSPGCVSLLSKGTSEKESAFMDASVSGNDVFFVTAAPLLPQDQDTSFDLYDARVCTEASPCQTPPASPPPPCTSAETCRSGSSSVPGFQAPPTSTFAGPGNSVQIVSGGALPSKVTKPAPLTRAQKLARALKSCRKLPHKTKAQKSKRAKCEAQAKKKYGAKKASHSHRRHK